MNKITETESGLCVVEQQKPKDAWQAQHEKEVRTALLTAIEEACREFEQTTHGCVFSDFCVEKLPNYLADVLFVPNSYNISNLAQLCRHLLKQM